MLVVKGLGSTDMTLVRGNFAADLVMLGEMAAYSIYPVSMLGTTLSPLEIILEPYCIFCLLFSPQGQIPEMHNSRISYFSSWF